MSFVFILPVVHPKGSKVSNYNHVEIALRQTIASLQNQTYSDVKIIVVCCQIPTWAEQLNSNVFFLDVSDSKTFGPNRNDVKVDKGLKYILGILYAAAHFKPSLYMLADADDYVDTQLAEYSIKSLNGRFGDKKNDGYLVDKGVQVEVDMLSEGMVTYKNAYLVKRFNDTCGTCRIFKNDSLNKKLLAVDANFFEKSKQWIPNKLENIVRVPLEFPTWLDSLYSDDYLKDWHIVNILGRHIKQKGHFNFILFPYVGAAKACGHGNHDGPRRGGLHHKKIIGNLPASVFRRKFGIQKKGLFDFDFLSELRFKIAFTLNRV